MEREVRGQRSEVGNQRIDDRGQTTEDRRKNVNLEFRNSKLAICNLKSSMLHALCSAGQGPGNGEDGFPVRHAGDCNLSSVFLNNSQSDG